MNPLWAGVGLAFSLFPVSAFAQHGTLGRGRPGAGPAVCGAEALPAVIQNRLKRECGSWKVQEPTGLSPSAHERWEAEKPRQCPGVAAGRFQNVTTPSQAVLRVRRQHAGAGYRFPIFSPRAGRLSYELKVVGQSDDIEAANLFIGFQLPTS